MTLRNFTSDTPALAWGYAALRAAAPGGGWGFRGFGYCCSCNRASLFVLAKRHAAWVLETAADWENGDAYKRDLAIRESSICALCRANLRMRAQARTVLDVAGLRTTGALIDRLAGEPDFAVFEAATNTVFRTSDLLRRSNYVASEFRENAPRGAIVDGILNQDLQALTFGATAFDIVLTSDVLEHVADLDRALDEICRVLKPGGFHVCTVPSDPALPRTIDGARVSWRQGRTRAAGGLSRRFDSRRRHSRVSRFRCGCGRPAVASNGALSRRELSNARRTRGYRVRGAGNEMKIVLPSRRAVPAFPVTSG